VPAAAPPLPGPCRGAAGGPDLPSPSPSEASPSMTSTMPELAHWEQQRYPYGFVTDLEADTFAPGLNEDVVRALSAKKGEPEWLTEWRLKAFRAWLEMEEPAWPKVSYPPIDYQAISYYSAPKTAPKHESL